MLSTLEKVPCADGKHHTETSFFIDEKKLGPGVWFVSFFPAFNFTLPNNETRQKITGAIQKEAERNNQTACFAFNFTQ